MVFLIGIETEGFWKGKEGLGLPPIGSETKKFAEALVSRYNKTIGKDLLRADFNHGSHPGHYHSSDGMDKWIVALDNGIGDKFLDGSKDIEGYPLEFVSPKLTFGPGSKWREEVKKHWDTLLQIGEVKVDNMCATHVHISPQWKVWSLEQLKQVAKAVVYFDDAFEVIYAPTRRDREVTKSNKSDNYILKGLDFGECCERIQRCDYIQNLVTMMQSVSPFTKTRDFAWNFMNTDMDFTTSADKPIGTIEFRCAPGVTTAEHCLIWVEFGVSFVQAAAQFDTNRIFEKEFKSDAEGLKRFILEAGVPNMNEKDLLDIVFYASDNELQVDADEQMTGIFDERIKTLQSSSS